MALSQKEKGIKEKKLDHVREKLTGRKSLRERILENHTNVLQTIDDEIAELELLEKALSAAK